jgi:hypothetical protein
VRHLIISITAIAITAVAAAPVQADGPREFNGGGKEPTPQTPHELYLSALKSDFATAYLAHRKAGGSPADFPAEELATLERELNDGQSFGIVLPASYPSNFYSNALGSPAYQEQINGCYCGPASAWMALAHTGAGNNYFGAELNQPNLATSFWLNTDPNCPGNGTGRGSNWTHTLNSWVDGTDAGWYLLTNYGYADAADVASKFVTDIDYNFAPVMNIHMNSARGYLPGWSAGWGDVWHYVPGFGYSQYGDYLNYVEVFGPVTSGYKYGVTKELFASILTDMGILW